jgi:hypothetical protein
MVNRLLVGLVALATIVHGARAAFPFYVRGDLLYHWAVARAIIHGQFPPGGAYEGLPAYYPPGFHALLAVSSIVSGLDVTTVTMLLGLAWLPVLPLTTYLVARRLTGRPNVALLAAVLTTFGGGFDVSGDRLWVNSLFLNGQEAYPLYPRDIVFGLLPLALWAFLRALDEPGRWLRWSLLSGAILGACALVQVQVLLPIPFAFAAPAIALAWRTPARRGRAIGALVVAGLVGLVAIAPWILGVVRDLSRNAEVGLDLSDNVAPIQIGFWNYPIQFGLFLPLAVVGVGVALLFLRRPDGPRPGGLATGRWSPRLAEGPLALIAWFAVPFTLAILYRPGVPLEDALRPQRLWLLADQPGAILAAMGLVTIAEEVVGGTWRRARLVVPAIVATVLVMTIPATVGTLRLLAIQWTDNEYADLRLDADHVPAFATLLDTRGPRTTVLTYEDWSALAWYQTGNWLVGMDPPGYAKLAFDPAPFTGRGQAARRADVATAFAGDPAAMVAIADRYDADEILLARRAAGWGLVDIVASRALGPDRPGATFRDGNGWDLVDLDAGARLALPVRASGTIDLELRFEGRRDNWPQPARRFRLLAVDPAGAERMLSEMVVPESGSNDWQVLEASIVLRAGDGLLVEATDPLTIQSVRGFVPQAVPPGWRVEKQTNDAVLLVRQP